jgi:hypothetical protein
MKNPPERGEIDPSFVVSHQMNLDDDARGHVERLSVVARGDLEAVLTRPGRGHRPRRVPSI